MRTSYKQQYVFGHDPIELKNVSAETFFGAKRGGFASAANCEPIDLKADKQMAYLKSILDIRVYEALKGGTSAVLTLYTCGATAEGVADVSNAKALVSTTIATADGVLSSSEPWMEITMPSNCKQFVYLGIEPTGTFTAGKILVHFNPNL